MADFVAVIRRAVDGLAENTPEMRVKVYERARGAVQRQLENMKPRPPEQMLRRQLEKLETAIVEVEAEHAEALPALDEPVVDEAPAAPAEEAIVPESQPYEPAEPAPVEHFAAEEHVEAVSQPVEEPVAVEPAPAAETGGWKPEEEHAEPQWHPPGEETQPAAAWHEPAAEEAAPDAAGHIEDARDTAVAAKPDWVEADRWPSEPRAEVPYTVVEDAAGPVASVDESAFVAHTREEPLHAESEAHFDAIWGKPALTPLPPEPEALWIGEDAPAHRPLSDDHHPVAVKMPAADEPFSWEAAVGEAKRHHEENVSQPQPVAAHFEDVDLFAEVHGKSTAQPPADAWREIEELNGYDAPGLTAANDSAASDDLMAPRSVGKSFRLEPKKRRFNFGAIAFILVCLAVVGGSGYAAWLNRTALNDMVSGLVSSARQTAKTETPGTTAPAANSATGKPATDAASNTTSPTTPASTAAPGTGGTKFTQRLLADGTEVDNGPAPETAQGTGEGKSVAAQNVASAATPAAAATTTGNVANAQNSGAATAPTAPVGDAQKMFLYEEKIGQSSPTAIQGSVVWTVKRDAGADGRSEPSVQGAITVPERNMSALVTFKRNSDPSLPASHLVEIVFSLPPNFEGGSIDSVQRIAMKQTEQDRGDALIAVPAKITDDFHMVALNDFPDAKAANLNLLKTRNWIDIPITYRNGRRALLTLEKGTTGTEAFDTAIKEWAALGDVSKSQ